MARPRSASREEAEVRAFVARLKSGESPAASLPWFDPTAPFVVARAPGRLDVIGGFADCSGALVLQLPIREAALAAAQHDPTPGLRIVGLANDEGAPRTLAIGGETLNRLLTEGLDSARAWFAERPDDRWGAYAAGVVVALAREVGSVVDPGLRIVIESRVPEGKGLGSSAAIAVAAMTAVAGLLDVPLSGEETALLCQKVENRVVGAARGIMDPMTAAVGRADQLLALLCQPAEVQGFIRPNKAFGFWGIDSGVRDAVSESKYASVRAGAFMGYRILAEHRGFPVSGPNKDGLMWVEDDRWAGRLANIDDDDEYRDQFPRLLPEYMRGNAFLARYGGTTDPATRVDPGKCYEVRHPAAFVVKEHRRARRFAELLVNEPDERAFRELGGMMTTAHMENSMCGLGCDAADGLFRLVCSAGRAKGLYGVRITGGGSGTVAVLGRADAGAAVKRVAREFEGRTGRRAHVVSGSSSGAAVLGVRRVPG